MRAILVGLALAISAAVSCASAAEKYIIDSGVWGSYQEYLRKTGNGLRPGAFVISRDGWSSFYIWCPDTRCMTRTSYTQDALNYCRADYGTECVVFAVRDEIKVDYEIAAVAPSASSTSSPPDLAPAPVTTVSVSPDVKADIDEYLGRAKSSGRVWALALAKDGSDVATANCIISGGYTSGACDPVQGAPQEIANRTALKSCGGPSRCILLYVGEQKQGNIDVVTR